MRPRGVVDAKRRLILEQECVDGLRDLRGRQAPVGLRATAGAAKSSASQTLARRVAGHRRVESAARLLIRQPAGRRREIDRHERRLADEDGCAAHAILDGGEIAIEFRPGRTVPLCARAGRRGSGAGGRRALRRDEVEGFCRDGAVGPWRPGERLDHQRIVDRGGHVDLEVLVRPSGVPEVPRLQVPVREAPVRHLLDGPFGSRLVVG